MIGRLVAFIAAMALAVSVTGAAAMAASAAAEGPAVRTIWDGVYTTAQAERGHKMYDTVCARCHNPELTGTTRPAPPLKGASFFINWQNRRMEDLFLKVRYTMPNINPGVLSDQEYIDTLAYVLMRNGASPGDAELPPDLDALNAIMFVPKEHDLSKIPNFTLVQVVGCLASGDNQSWLLTQTGDPVLTSRKTPIRPQTPGTDTYRLVSIAPFDPSALNGHEVAAKGLVDRDSSYNRLNVTAVQSLASTCTK